MSGGDRGKRRDRFSEQYRRRRSDLSPALRTVADFIDRNRVEAMTCSAFELAAAIGTSDATVIRTVQALGFTGLAELRRELAVLFGEGNTLADNLSRSLSDIDANAEDAVGSVLLELEKAIAALRRTEARRQITEALECLHVAKRIALYGVGPSSHLAAYFGIRLRRQGRKQFLLTERGAGLADQLLELEPGDTLLMLAYGSAYPEAEATIAEARQMRIPIVLISDSLDEKLARQADVVVRVARGRSERFSLHGATLACLEALLLGLAAADQSQAVASLERLLVLLEATARRRIPRRRRRGA